MTKSLVPGILVAVLALTSAPLRAQGDEFVPFEESAPRASPGQPDPTLSPPPPSEAAPPSAPAPAAPPTGPAPVPAPPQPSTSPDASPAPAATAKEGMPDPVVWLAQCGTACVVPMIAGNLAIIPGVGQVLVFLIPALNGFLVQVVGDALSGRKTSPWAAIIGAYIGQFCVMPVCTSIGVGTFLALYLGGALAFLGGTVQSRDLNPLTLGFWLGLGAIGGVAMGAAIVAGQATSAIIPVAAHALFAKDENPGPAAPQAVQQAPRAATPQVHSVAAMAY